MPSSLPNSISIIEPLCSVFRRKLKQEGLKYTPERAQILEAIIEIDSIFQADQLLEYLKRDRFRVSKATIYRTLKLLEEAGILQRVLFDAEQSHYQLAYGKRSTGVIINVDTKDVTEVDIPELAAISDRICSEHHVVPEGHRLVIYVKSANDT